MVCDSDANRATVQKIHSSSVEREYYLHTKTHGQKTLHTYIYLMRDRRDVEQLNALGAAGIPIRSSANICNLNLPPFATCIKRLPGCGLGDVVEQCAVPDQAPVVVLRLTEALERLGWENETIYRTSPVSTGPPELRQALDTDPAAVDCEQYDLSVLADALRFYLQELPCPLIPAVVYSELVYTAQETQSLEECGQQLKRILDSPSIPQSNHQLLVYLTRHLSKVTQSGGAAQASPKLLGQVYSEAVFKNNHFSADVNPEHHVKILEALIVVGGLMEMQAAPGRPALHWASSSPPG
ncbi:hypothetical protein MHYP_G00333250 [Metynnis hypsauchen]